MANNYNLIKSGLIDFNTIILDKYSFIGLNEVELVTLIKLQEINKKGITIDVSALPKKMHESMQLSEPEISDLLVKLIEGKYIELCEEDGKVLYSLDPTYKRLGNVIDSTEESNKQETNSNELAKVVSLIEKEFNCLINPLDLELIKSWINNDEFNFYDINEAVLEALKRKRKTVKVVNEILRNKKEKENRQVKNPSELTALFNDVYGKIKS